MTVKLPTHGNPFPDFDYLPAVNLSWMTKDKTDVMISPDDLDSI